MRNPNFFLIFLYIFISNIVFTQSNFELTVHVKGDYNDYLFLLGEKRDSSLVVEGKAKFKGSQDIPQQLAIIMKGIGNVAWVFLENSQIDMYCSYYPADSASHQMLIVDTIIGSQSNQELYHWRTDIRKLNADKDSLQS